MCEEEHNEFWTKVFKSVFNVFYWIFIIGVLVFVAFI